MMSVSVDGSFEGPDRALDRRPVDEAAHRHFSEQLRSMSAFLDGRVTHELRAGFRPTADAGPSCPAPMAE
ncbi:hypothetical protein AB0G71_09445 [Streptomyces sp. NPDC020403]|uniref:hypothetical protein n=1 Tax=unclassified Streptomyces TaxID=2593676 RepID=UPI003408029E